MKEQKQPTQIPHLYRRIIMFAVICALVLLTTYHILPGNAENALGDIALNPIAQIGLFIVLSLGGALLGFWIVFGDLFRPER